MSQHTVAIIGTGPDPATPTVEGFAMGYRHAEAYRANDQCQLVGCVDLIEEHAVAFADEFDLPDSAVFTDTATMLDSLAPEIVSVTVPPSAHEAVVTECGAHDSVQAIHCEKPIADTWLGAQRLVQASWRTGTQLTFNRQRRFSKPFTEAKALLDANAIGTLERIEIGWGDFFDTGAHTVDLAGMFVGERPAEWVIAQLDYHSEDVRFGTHQENQMWAQWRYDSGVHGMLATGEASQLVDATMVLRGTDGTIAIDPTDGATLELTQDGKTSPIDVDGESIHHTPADSDLYGSRLHSRAIDEMLTALETGRESTLSGRIGLNTAEILFAGYESVRRRERIDLPLSIADHPLESLVETGAITPTSQVTD